MQNPNPQSSTFDQSGLWLLGSWQYNPSTGELSKGQVTERLPTQLNEVMWLLVKSAPQVVSREQFMNHVWADKWVNEDALSRSIAELRKLLGDSASQAKYIKTIPKKGYLLTQVPELKKAQTKRFRNMAMLGFLFFSILLATYFFAGQETPFEQLQKAVSNATRVTSFPGMEQQSTLSANGQWLSYVRFNNQGSQIVLDSMVDANQQHLIELPRHRLGSPLYLPERDQVIFTARDQTTCYLKSFQLSSQQFSDLGGCDFHSESRTIDWNAATQNLVYVNRDQAGLTGIHTLSLESGLGQVLTEPPSVDLQDTSPTYSPNKQWLSFSRGNQSVRNVWIKHLKSGESYPITSGEHYSISHSWFDNEHIVYDSDSSGSRQLWMIHIHDREPQLLGAYGAQHPAFDSKRSLMTFQEVSYEANIWLLDTETQDYSRVVHSTKYDNYPVFSSTGDQFLFSSNRQDQSAIWQYDFASNQEKLLVAMAGAKLTRPSWHSSENKILMTINDQHGYGTLIYDLDDRHTSRLEFGYGHLDAVEHNGVYYALAKSAELNNQILRLEDDQMSIIPISSISRFMVLANGELIYSKTTTDGLFIFNQKTQKERQVTPLLRSRAMNLWTVVNQAAYFDRGGVDAGLWRLDLNTGDLVMISSHRPFSVGTSLSVNKAETQVLITRTDRAESDILQVQLKP